MICTLLDACRYFLEDLGEAQSSYWLASQVVEMKLWRASQSGGRVALHKDIEKHGEASLFVEGGEGEYALRSWEGERTGENGFQDETCSHAHTGRMAAGNPAGDQGCP